MADFHPRLDKAMKARGTNANAASKAAGYPGIVNNWKHKGQDPSLGRFRAVCDAIQVDPAWVAFGGKPKPIAPPNGFSAARLDVNQPDTLLGVVHSAWKADNGSLEDRFFDCLELVGLLDALYVLDIENGILKYKSIGTLYIQMLGWQWWVAAPNTAVGEDEPDPAFAGWSLGQYHSAIGDRQARRDHCRVISRYTEQTVGWEYDRIILPCQSKGRDLVLVVNQVERE